MYLSKVLGGAGPPLITPVTPSTTTAYLSIYLSKVLGGAGPPSIAPVTPSTTTAYLSIYLSKVLGGAGPPSIALVTPSTTTEKLRVAQTEHSSMHSGIKTRTKQNSLYNYITHYKIYLNDQLQKEGQIENFTNRVFV